MQRTQQKNWQILIDRSCSLCHIFAKEALPVHPPLPCQRCCADGSALWSWCCRRFPLVLEVACVTYRMHTHYSPEKTVSARDCFHLRTRHKPKCEQCHLFRLSLLLCKHMNLPNDVNIEKTYPPTVFVSVWITDMPSHSRMWCKSHSRALQGCV